MRLVILGAALGWASAAGAQPAGWTVEARPNAATPAAFKVVATRTFGEAKLTFERSMLGGVSYKLEQDGCSSSSGGAGSDLAGAERIAAIRDAMMAIVRDKDNFCKVPASAISGLTSGIDQAIASADAAFDKGRPNLTTAPRTAEREGWTIEDRAGDLVEGLPTNHIFRMRKAAGPVLLTYTNDLPLYSDRVGAGSRSIVGKVRDCEYNDSDASEFVLAANRARDFRARVEANLATTGCDVTPEKIAAALAGFDAAYVALDAWAAERLDERRLLQQAASAADTP